MLNTTIVNEEKFTAFDLLNAIGDALLKYKARSGMMYSVKTTLELPEESFERVLSESEMSKDYLSNFSHGPLLFSIKINEAI